MRDCDTCPWEYGTLDCCEFEPDCYDAHRQESEDDAVDAAIDALKDSPAWDERWTR